MHEMLQGLSKDHGNMFALLTAMERQLLAISKSSSVDFTTVRDVIEYMVEYPDKNHHPTEELIFERLAKHDFEARTAVNDLHKEHLLLSEKGLAFRDLLQQLSHDSVFPLEQLLDAGHAYLNLLRGHMRTEESVIFPWANRSLNSADWQVIAEIRPSIPDPMFGSEVQAPYLSLFDSLDQQ